MQRNFRSRSYRSPGSSYLPSDISDVNGKFKKRGRGTSCGSILAILLSVGLLAVAGIAVFGAPGLSPGFKRTNKGPATPVSKVAAQLGGLHGDDVHPERAEHVALDRQIRADQARIERERLLSEEHQKKERERDASAKHLQDAHDHVAAGGVHNSGVHDLAAHEDALHQKLTPEQLKALEEAHRNDPEHGLHNYGDHGDHDEHDGHHDEHHDDHHDEHHDDHHDKHHGAHWDEHGEHHDQHWDDHHDEHHGLEHPHETHAEMLERTKKEEAHALHEEKQELLKSIAEVQKTVPIPKEVVHSPAPPAATGVYALSAKDENGVEVPLSSYMGKVTIFVNLASKCGYTKTNYEGLTKLYQEYHPKGVEILGFPCNQFGQQEPGTCKEVKAFAASNYQAQFPIFDKVEVNGPNMHPVYKFLKTHTPENHGGGGDVDWNFAKWVVDKKGFPVVRYPSSFDRDSLVGWLNYELSKA
eukprot:CAMPEP_0206146822 /NCGR_PEP_ID=MMETSP1473-20131121/31532_1 /ASSEMBLY_ACC=CAM_ASM_001109 /TAXON_ID=1461547 /ORGANISM="Stichococcus sp, Strain RCC1054" /LENGTH=469 /DNA_ID=CAMNT_0053543523 /DNA_START=213 /DNA_END=1622 /DNA_ORIENTATION=+